MFEAIKPLLDSDLINEDTRQQIQEAWETKLAEIRDEVRVEITEEFADRYNHDKEVMVEALDSMVTEALEGEIKEIVAEKVAMANDRVKFNKQMRETAETFDTFLTTQLAKEVKEFRNDRQKQNAAIQKLESFVVDTLADELTEFHQDKKAVVETRVRLVKEGKENLVKLEKAFITKSAKIVETTVTKQLTKELTQLKDDIQIARENNFGRKIFETFASEFGASHLNENAEILTLKNVIVKQENKINTFKDEITSQVKVVESKDQELAVINESVKRSDTLTQLLTPLGKEKASIMQDLLESVNTPDLVSAFDKYLPAVLKSGVPTKKPLNEDTVTRKAVTGDKTTPREIRNEGDNVVELRKLAGLN